MPNISVRQKINNINRFYDVTYYWQKLGKCIYQGYVTPGQFNNKDAAGIERYDGYSQYKNFKGVDCYRKDTRLPNIMGKYLINNMYAEYPLVKIESSTTNEQGETSTIIDEAQTDQLIDILTSNKWFIKERNLLETQLHMGDRVIKPYLDRGVLKIDYINADGYFTTNEENNEALGIVLYTFAERDEGKKRYYYTRLEWHGDFNELSEAQKQEYGISPDDIGRFIKVELYKSTAAEGNLDTYCFNELRNVFGEVRDQEFEMFKGLETPTYAFDKNVNQNNKDLHSSRGLGLFINALDSFMSINEAFNSKSTDNVYGEMKVITPGSATDETLHDNGSISRHFINSPEIMVFSDDGMQGNKPEAYAPMLRTEQHVLSMNTDADIGSSDVGISAGSFRFDGRQFETATQFIGEKSETAKTIREMESSNSEFWKDLFMLLKWFIDNYQTQYTKFTFERDNIKIDWKDNVIVDDETERAKDERAVQNDLMPKVRFLMKHYDLEQTEAMQWLAEVEAENTIQFDNTTDFNNPIPSPRPDESQDEYVNRVMGMAELREEHDDDELRTMAVDKFNEGS